MKIKVNGKPHDFSDRTTPQQRRLLALLDKLPDGEALTSDQVAIKLGTTADTVKTLHDKCRSLLDGYTIRATYGGTRPMFYANPRTIKAIREMQERAE